MLAHVDDEELPKNEPIRIKQEIVHPRRNLRLREVGKGEESKLAKVRGESIEIRRKMQTT
jgi:hypothetical protein